MAEHGGYREPAHPAAVSGPGALSQRTDGGAASQPTMVADGGPYGSRKDMENIQGSAPMQGTPSPRDLVPLNAPTQRPDEPITSGAAAGPGIGPQAAGIEDDNTRTLKQLAPFVSSLELMANLPNATPQSRAYVRALKAQIAALPQQGVGSP